MSTGVRVCIITGFGINTDREMATAFGLTGAHPVRVHANDLIADPAALDRFAIFVVPGGFSFGDHVGSGALLAALLRRALREPLTRFVDRGGLVLGVCNGFQVLVRMGLVPGGVAAGGMTQSVALVHNDSGRFEDRWVRVAFDAASPCVWTRGIASLELPVRHGEGKLVASAAQLAAIDAAHLGAARYALPATEPAAAGGSPLPYPANPNGSLRDLAGLCDPSGQVLGLMPHPEAFLHRYHHPAWRNATGAAASVLDEAALGLFRNAVLLAADSRYSR
ncbi:MAG: phosphoribosylformylglycinamidine synthase subunit PurQ [Spirochaetaceae bacterium]|nr:phosphoribosylformylglycinamidine synthase subunit PurQ [Spirochaetaceae bacterium]